MHKIRVVYLRSSGGLFDPEGEFFRDIYGQN